MRGMKSDCNLKELFNRLEYLVDNICRSGKPLKIDQSVDLPDHIAAL